MDPKGLELPTQIFATAAETIDLSAYHEEIRPFSKELNIDKYPEVVAFYAKCRKPQPNLGSNQSKAEP